MDVWAGIKKIKINNIMKNANELVFRASSMSDIMTGVAKNWKVDDSLTCKRKLVQIFRELNWKRKANKGNKYTEKGLKVEPDSITLYSRYKKELFNKNDVRLTNKHFTGEVDLYVGESVDKATKVIDIKSSWDWKTFPSLLDNDSSKYKEQAQVYMALTGAKVVVIAHCLVNTPAEIIHDEMKRLQWKMQVIDTDTSPEYLEGCKEIEKDCIYDRELFEKHFPFYDFKHTKEEWVYDIPISERVHEVVIHRDDEYIAKMEKRVEDCRRWMNDNLFKDA
jgi:hypothetical protein